MDSIKKILAAIDDAIASFQDTVPGIQDLVYKELQPVLKQLEIKNGRLLNNVNNLKLIGTLKNTLQRIIVSANYKDAVGKFVDSFGVVSNLNNKYFAKFNNKYTPKETLPLIRNLAIETTITDLLGQGMNTSVIEPIRQIFTQNITTGGSYADFQETLRNHITKTDSEGSLERYTKQITTDAIHQYNAQYQDAIAQDLQFNWGRYIGSNITTTRQFCFLLTKQQWVHKSQLPEIIKGHIGNVECKLSKSTGLPLGMIPGTNAANFKIMRGGYNCGHQFFWVPDSAVPADILSAFKQTGKAPEVKLPKEDIKSEYPIAAQIKTNNAATIKDYADRGIKFYDDIAQHWDPEVNLSFGEGGSYYSPDTKLLHITNEERSFNEYYQKKIMLHEGGHAMHMNENIITFDQVDDKFMDFYKSAKEIIKGKESKLETALMKIYKDNRKDPSAVEQILIYTDTLGGLTNGSYGMGHAPSYYSRQNLGKMEVFAHSITLLKLDNIFSEVNEEIIALTKLMKEYASSVL